MVAEICLGQVGAVAAREVSRFARNSREWQRLVEVCRVVDTLLIDQETVYTPRQSNDRLLLGLKGSLNEYELDLLRQRSVEARREKARRGELIVAAPAGYIKSPDQRLEKDPDRRIQEALIPEAREGYISLEQHEQIQQMMSDNCYGREQVVCGQAVATGGQKSSSISRVPIKVQIRSYSRKTSLRVGCRDQTVPQRPRYSRNTSTQRSLWSKAV